MGRLCLTVRIRVAAVVLAMLPVVAISACGGSGAGSATKTPSLSVAYVAPIGAMEPLWMADETHSFAGHQMKVQMRYIQANAAIAALLARDVDVLEISAPPVLTADLHSQGKPPIVFVGSALNHAILSLYVAPSIKTAEQLKGATLASDRPGTPNDYAIRAALSLLGVKASDVNLLPVGSSDAELGALESGQVKGAILGPPQSFTAASKGFRDLQDTYSVPYQNVGFAVLRSRLDELGPTLVPFLGALRDGIKAYNGQPKLAQQVLQKYSKEQNPDILKKTYEFYRDRPFETSLQPTMAGIQGNLDFLVATVPQARGAKASDFVELRFLRQLPSQ